MSAAVSDSSASGATAAGAAVLPERWSLRERWSRDRGCKSGSGSLCGNGGLRRGCGRGSGGRQSGGRRLCQFVRANPLDLHPSACLVTRQSQNTSALKWFESIRCASASPIAIEVEVLLRHCETHWRRRGRDLASSRRYTDAGSACFAIADCNRGRISSSLLREALAASRARTLSRSSRYTESRMSARAVKIESALRARSFHANPNWQRFEKAEEET